MIQKFYVILHNFYKKSYYFSIQSIITFISIIFSKILEILQIYVNFNLRSYFFYKFIKELVLFLFTSKIICYK